MSSKEKWLFYNDGHVCHSNQIILASQFYEDEGSAFSRVSMVRNFLNSTTGNWYYANLEDTVISVTYTKSENISYFMGKNGNILVNGQGQRRVETIPDAGKYGDILRIRAINDNVYICGMTGQILIREKNGWQHIDESLLGTYELDFEDIDGSNYDDIYAVGMQGVIYHFDGKVWNQIDSPTNRSLSNVRCLSKKEVYICGDNGSLFRGNKDNGWLFMGDPKINHNFWGMESYKGKIYVAYQGGIMTYDGNNLSYLDFDLDKKIDCHRLSANDGVLLSCGVDNLAIFNGQKWSLIGCPENV